MKNVKWGNGMDKQQEIKRGLDEIWGLERFRKGTMEEGFYHEVLATMKPVGPTVSYHNEECVNFASINILDTHQEADVMAHFHQACDIYGLTTGGSRVTQGISKANLDMEKAVCRVTGRERAISFASGLLANIGFLNAMSCKFQFSSTCYIDNSDAVFVLDRDCHWSLWKGVSHLRFGRQLFYFQHNNVADLEQVLKRLSQRHKKIVVVFESIYSADGSIAPMQGILDACEKYHAVSYADDANGFMIYGPQQRPFAKEFAELKRANFVMMSFSKGVGLEGGAIVGDDAPINTFEVLSGTSLFTAAIQPPTASTIQYIIEKLTAQPSIMDTYLQRSLALRKQLEEMQLTLNQDPSYIISVMIGNDEKAVNVYDNFLKEHMIVPMFRYPAVKPGHALIRIMLNAHHTQEQVEHLLKVMGNLKKKYQF